MLVGSCNIIWLVAASSCKSPAVDSKVFPLSLKFPVSTLDPFMKVVLDPSVNVAPLVRSIFNASALKFTVPVSCSTWNRSPTLKSPLWSTELNLIFASLVASTSFAWIASVGSFVTSFPVPM